MRDLAFRLRRNPIGLAAVILLCLSTSAAWARSKVDPEQLPRLEQTGVVVPWEDFKKILEEIRRVEPAVTPAPPPVDFALSACGVAVTVTEDEKQARVLMEFSLEVLNAERWVEVPVIADGVALSRFEIDGRAASVYRRNGYHSVALRGEGRHEVTLEYFAQVAESRGAHSTLLRFPGAPVISLELTVPRSRLAFQLDGAVVRSTERTNGSTRVLAAFQQARDASISWFKQAELEKRETKLFGELRTLLTVGDGMLRGTSKAVFTIHGRGVDRFRVGLPADLTVLDVAAQGVEDWAVEPLEGEAESRRVLTVRLNYLAQGGYSFVVSFERNLGASTVETEVPDLTLPDAVRDTGFIAVAAATNVEINPVGEFHNAVPVDPTETPRDLITMTGQPVLHAFKYLRHPVGVGLSIVKHDDLAVKRIIVESAHLFTYLSPEGKRITSARYRVRNNRKQYLELTLPEGGEGWGAYVNDQPVKAARTEQGKILVPLRPTVSAAGEGTETFDVELVYFQRESYGRWGRLELSGPRLDVDAMEVQWHLFLPRDKRYAGFEGNLHPDDELNRVVYVETTAYNLQSSDDLGALRRSGLDQDVSELEAQREDKPVDERSRAKHERLEREVDRLKRRAAVEQNAGDPGADPQGSSRPSGAFFDTAGRLRGVLPVRFHIPVDGLRLSFTGRILTAAEAPLVSIDYWPAVWILSGTAVLVISFALALVGLVVLGARHPLSRKLIVTLPAIAALIGLYGMVPGQRGALVSGVLLAAAGYAATRVWLRRRAATTAMVFVALLAVGAAESSATEIAPTARPQIPDLPGTEVTLSWADFKELVEKTYVPPTTAPPPPTEAFLRSAEYTGHLQPGILTLRGSLQLEVLKDGWVRLPLDTEGTVIRFEGRGALLNRDGSRLEILARGPGSYALDMTLAFHAADHPGENRLALRLPDAPRNLLDLTTAAEIRDVEVETGLAYETRDERVYVSLPGGALTVKYTLPFRRIEETADEELTLEPAVQLTAYQLLNVGEGVAGGVLIHDYQVRIAKVSHFDIDLPDGVVVFDCNVEGLESWKILQRDGQRYLRVKLLAPSDGRLRVIVSFEQTYDVEQGSVPVPRFNAVGIERQSGFVAVAADGAEVALELSGNLLPADVSEIPADARVFGGNLLRVCKYSGDPDRATVTVTEHEDARVLTAIVETLNATAAVLDNGTEATWVDLTIKNNRKQFLRLTLPADDVEVWSLLLDGQPAKPKRSGDAVLVPLPRGNGEVGSRISLVLLRKGPGLRWFGRLAPVLPTFDVPVSEAMWTVYLPAGKSYVAGGGEFRPVIVTDPLLPGRRNFSPSLARRDMPSGPVEGKLAYDEAVSPELAEAQLRQETEIAQQLGQKSSARKGSLPVRIAIPGGLSRLPKITVSRMLIVGDEPNTFQISVYPAWAPATLRVLQLLCMFGAALTIGLVLAREWEWRRLRWAVLPGLVGLIPFGGLGTMQALVITLVLSGLVRLSIAVARRAGASSGLSRRSASEA